jgi:hypothetical protein
MAFSVICLSGERSDGSTQSRPGTLGASGPARPTRGIPIRCKNSWSSGQSDRSSTYNWCTPCVGMSDARRRRVNPAPSGWNIIESEQRTRPCNFFLGSDMVGDLHRVWNTGGPALPVAIDHHNRSFPVQTKILLLSKY